MDIKAVVNKSFLQYSQHLVFEIALQQPLDLVS